MQKIRCELEKMFPFCSAIELYIETHRHTLQNYTDTQVDAVSVHWVPFSLLISILQQHVLPETYKGLSRVFKGIRKDDTFGVWGRRGGGESSHASGVVELSS